jgi:predicted Holliday junction resolvase-like endonuclease
MIFDPSDTIVLAVIGFVQVVVIAMLAIILKRAETTKKDVAATKEQIVNDHPQTPNFREENDRRHNETKEWFLNVWRRQEGLNKKVSEIEDTVVYLATGYANNRDDIDQIQDYVTEKKNERNTNI